MWYGVQNMSKYDIDIKVQPLTQAHTKDRAVALVRPKSELLNLIFCSSTT